MTYSRCCQRPSRPVRLTTLVLPLTAPTSGRRRAGPGGGRVSGSNTVSPSTMTMRSWAAAAMPVLSAAGLPLLAWRITRTLGRPSASTTAAVPSVDPSSTTITSSSPG